MSQSENDDFDDEIEDVVNMPHRTTLHLKKEEEEKNENDEGFKYMKNIQMANYLESEVESDEINPSVNQLHVMSG
eukprot:CAMPEP_0116870818 /NCGR_PEP_ID=MMETSP0463-20121206/900_1 /TAXON_ID=181622 /ORGANISM="Strombidinopsis sp, Strain SopsisLIS2011" /LENGTH=74 /DNA_ID=CAMNT_0004508083 /DNA_START=5976 /DNA_END=6200 /DNA_ORIENTATION=+